MLFRPFRGDESTKSNSCSSIREEAWRVVGKRVLKPDNLLVYVVQTTIFYHNETKLSKIFSGFVAFRFSKNQEKFDFVTQLVPTTSELNSTNLFYFLKTSHNITEYIRAFFRF